jgi:hypothetical protein
LKKAVDERTKEAAEAEAGAKGLKRQVEKYVHVMYECNIHSNAEGTRTNARARAHTLIHTRMHIHACAHLTTTYVHFISRHAHMHSWHTTCSECKHICIYIYIQYAARAGTGAD